MIFWRHIIRQQAVHARASTTTNIYGHVIDAAHAKGLRTLDKFNDLLAQSEVSS